MGAVRGDEWRGCVGCICVSFDDELCEVNVVDVDAVASVDVLGVMEDVHCPSPLALILELGGVRGQRVVVVAVGDEGGEGECVMEVEGEGVVQQVGGGR